MLHFIGSKFICSSQQYVSSGNADLSTAMTFVAASVESVHNLQTEEKFCDIWDEVVTQIDAHSRRPRRHNRKVSRT